MPIRPNGVIGVSVPNEEAEVTTMATILFAQSIDIVYWIKYLLLFVKYAYIYNIEIQLCLY